MEKRNIQIGSFHIIKSGDVVRIDDMDQDTFTVITESEFEMVISQLFIGNQVESTLHWFCDNCKKTVPFDEVSDDEIHVKCGGTCS